MTAVMRLLRRRRSGVATGLVIVLALGAVVAWAVRADGYTARHVDLNDGGIWVTNDAEGLFGRLNKPIGQLDAGFYPPGGFTAGGFSVDVVQDASTVLAWDKGSGKVFPVDVRAGLALANQAAAVAATDRLELGGGSAAVLEPSTGKLWAARLADGDTSGVAKLDSSQKPLVTAGAGADLAVGVDGTVYVASAATQTLYTIHPAGTGFSAPTKASFARKMASLHLTVVGSTPVVFDPAGAVLAGGRAPVVVPQAAGGVLQQPGPDAATVLVATPGALLSVGLDGAAPQTLFSGGTGTPARPVRLGACIHAAWGGQPGRYARSCDGAPVSAQAVPTRTRIGRPVFRVNRDQIVLNDLTSGDIWLVDDAAREIDNWQAVRPPTPAPKDNKPTKPDKNIRPSTQDRPPVAKPDDVGARPGRTSVLNLLDNDADPDGDTLVITAVTGLDDPSAPVSIAADGQTVQIALPSSASGAVHFSYTVSDGRGLSASTDVTVQVRTPDQNGAPRTRLGYTPKTWTVSAGGTFSYPVLSDWRDPADADPLTVGAASVSDGTVVVTDDGAVVFSAGQNPGPQQIRYHVSDGIADPVDGVLKVNVLGANATDAVPATAEPDVVRAVVGKSVTISPLANDIPGSDPNDPTTRMAIAAPVAQPVGASVSTDLVDGVVTVTAKRAGTTLLSYRVAFGSAKLATGVIRVDAVVPPSRPPSPVAMPDTAVLRGQQASIVDVLANDYDPSGQVLVVQRGVPLGQDSGLQVAVIQGHWLRIQSSNAQTGGVRLIQYTITDGSSEPVTGQVSVVQQPAPETNLPPLPTDDTATVRAGDYVDVAVLDNDIDPNGDPLRLKPVRVGSLTEGQLTTTPALGSAYLAGSLVRYEAPPTVAAPTQVLVDYVVTDPDGASAVGHVQVTVTPLPADQTQDQPPAPRGVQRTVVAGDQLTITIPATGVDPDGDSVSLVGLAGPPTLGRVTAIGPTTLTYQSYPRSGGTDTFGYTVTDRFGQTGTALIRIGVVPPGDPQPPVAVNDEVTASPGAKVNVAVLGNDYTAADDTVSVAPLDTVNDGVPPGVSLDKDHVLVTAPPADGRPLVVSYAIVGGTGARSVAQVIVDGLKNYDIPPVARDDVARPSAGATAATVDVLANDDDPDGSASDLRISQVFPAGLQVSGSKITVPLKPYAQSVGYELTDKGGARALAIVHVPASGGSLPGLRPNISPITMSADSSKSVSIGDYVVDPAGKTLRLTTTDRIWASPANGLSATSKNDSTLTLTSHGGYTGPAAVIFEVTNGDLSDPQAEQVIVSVPVQIGSSQPVLRCPDSTLTVVQGGPTLPVDLLTVCHVWVPDSGSLGEVRIRASWSKRIEGVDLAQSGNAGLSIVPTAQARAGTAGTISIAVAGTPVTATLGVRVIAAAPPIVAPLTIRGLKAGQSQTVDVRPYIQTPLRGPSISVVSVSPVTQSGVSVQAGGAQVTVTAAPGGTHGTMTYGLVLTDVAGAGHDDRHVSTTLTVSVLGLPGTPGRPSVVQTLSHTAVVAFTQPVANGAPLDQIELLDSHGGQHVCPASPCTVGGLTNNTPYTFTVRAHNVVGYGPVSPPSAAVVPDQKPGAVTGVAATAGDTAAVVRWDALRVDGSPVSSYQVLISPAPDAAPGVITVGAGTTTVTARGLTNGTTYSFKVKAQNKKGFGPFSLPASAVPFGTPVAPAPPTAAGANSTDNSEKAITVTWSAPADNGNGRPVSGYTVYQYRNGAAAGSKAVSGSTTSTVFGGLANDGSTYRYTVTATNSGNRTSAPSGLSNTVTAAAKPAPTGAVSATATGTTGQIKVQFTLGQPHAARIDHVNYTVSNGGPSGSWSVTGGPGTTITENLGGLQDGADSSGPSYQVTVSECNETTSPCSDPTTSNSVHPYGPPTAPTGISGSVSGQSITWVWGGGDGNGKDWNYQTSLDGAGWVSRVHTTSYTASGFAYSSRHTLRVRIVNSSGVATGSLSDPETIGAAPPPPPPPPPPNPADAQAIWGASAAGQPNCSSSDCHYVRIKLSNFKANSTISGTFQSEQHPWSGGPRPFSVTTNGSGDGTGGDGYSYYGYPGTTIDIVINGKTYTSTWP